MPTAIGSDAIIDAIQEAIVVVDRELRVVRANASALAMLGLRSEELLGRPCAEVVNCEACRDNCPFQRILNGGAAERQFNIRLDGPWGDAGRRICLTSNPVVDARGAVTGLVENIRDVGHLNELLFRSAPATSATGFKPFWTPFPTASTPSTPTGASPASTAKPSESRDLRQRRRWGSIATRS